MEATRSSTALASRCPARLGSRSAAVQGRPVPVMAQRAVQRRATLSCVASSEEVEMGRRDAIVRAGAAALVLGSQTVLPGAALAAKVPSGFTAVKDSQKGYAFAYPVGWQEFTSDVQDKVFKDVIEPLESVSLNIVPTQRKSLTDIGTPEEVAKSLVEKSRNPSTKVELVSSRERKDEEGRLYYTFEFTSSSSRASRHAISTIAIANGKAFTLTAGASEKRWSKMKDKLNVVADSFVLYGY